MSPHIISQLFPLRLRNSTSQDAFAAAGGFLAAAAAVSSLWFASTSDEQAESAHMIPPLLHPRLSSFGAKFPLHNNLLTTSQFTFCEAINNSSNSHHQSDMKVNVNSHQIIMECDYAILGHGKAGQSAVRILRKLDPNANIVIIDPNNNYHNHHQNATNKRRGNINHLQTHASFIDHSNKLIRLHANPSPNAHDMNAINPVVHFRKSALIATGSRGAPPPNECIDNGARGRVLELRSTSLPPTQSSSMQQLPRRQQASIPILDPPTVRSLSLLASSQSATVAVMGSGFDALELAASLSRMQQQQRSTKNGNNSDGSNNKKVILMFGNAGPMSTRLPRYLSAAVSKRLRQCGIDVEDRSMARYLSMESSSSVSGAPPRLALYTEKSYDHLDSKRMTTDLLVLAPNVDGNNGTSVISTVSSTANNSYSQNQHHQYLPWSSLVAPPLLTCYVDDGRVATNSEYQAASNIYAAGSVTRSPNPRNGRADVAGGSSACSARVGEIAARNMIRDNVVSRSGRSGSSDVYNANVGESIPVWRSDVVPYLQRINDNISDESIEQKSNSVASETLALYSMGIHALCVGRCDSETLATHGFWWTNTNQQTNNNDDKNSNSSSNSSRGRRMNTLGPNAFMRRITKKATSTVNGSKSRIGSGSLPVYGSGVVYYLDRTGSICGIMLWGLPFAEVPNDVKSTLNHLIVERIKKVISSNGTVAIRDHSKKIAEEHAGLNVDLNLLSYLHLVEESKLLASMALSGLQPKEDIKIGILGKPLHRYTPIKSHELSSLGKLRRREMGYIAEEDDLFYPTYATTNEESSRPPSLKRIYPMHGGATATNVEKEMELRQLQVDRSRPSKEEPLWMRKGEEQKYVNYREAMDQSFYRNIQQGKFSDGTDAVKQAPVPQAYLEAKEQLKSLTGMSSSREDGEDDNESD